MASGLIASFQDCYDDLLRFLTRRTGDAQRAADIAQDTYIRLRSAATGATEISNHRAYIYRIAGNLAIDMMRREGRQTAWLTGDEPDENISDPAPSPEQAAIASDRLQQIEKALGALPPKARLALLLFRVDGLPHAEIARRLDVSESMVAKYIGQALRHCRNHLWRLDQQ